MAKNYLEVVWLFLILKHRLFKGASAKQGVCTGQPK